MNFLILHFYRHRLLLLVFSPATELEEVLREYFYNGYTAKEMVDLLEEHGVQISHSHLRCRVMPELGLVKKRANRPAPQPLMDAVREITREGPNGTASASSITHALRAGWRMNTIRSDVVAAQRALDPQQVEARRTGRLQRRTYRSEGANFIWHCDGYDKLAPYGLPIHGCIDGFSRFIIWLKVAPTNHRADQTCLYFVEAVSQYCLPHTVRMDAGTENNNIELAQTYLSLGLPRITPLACTLTGSSNHNERIERFWGLLRQQKTNFWINHMKDFIAAGQMIAWDAVDRKISYFVYNELVRQHLVEMVNWHNTHRIRSQRNVGIVSGKPSLMYKRPDKFGHMECGKEAPPDKLDMVRTQLCVDVAFDPVMRTTLEGIVYQAGLQYPPPTIADADVLYLHLRREYRANHM